MSTIKRGWLYYCYRGERVVYIMYVYVTTSWSNASSKWLAYALLALHKRHRSGAKEHQHQRQHHQQGGGYIWRSPGTYWQSDIGSIHMYVSVRSMYLPGGSFVQSKESRRKQVVGRSSKKSSRPCKGMVAGCSRGTVYITWWHRQQQPQQSWPLNNYIIRHYILYGRSRLLFFLFSFFFPSHLLSSPFYSLSPLVVTQIRGHIAGSFPPSLLRFVPCNFIARRFQLFPRRLASHCAYPR